jgi:hypothetical protein
MTKDKYDDLVAGLHPMYGIILAEAAKGPITVPKVKALVGRQTGMWDEMKRLVKFGLLRYVGTDMESSAGSIKPRVYVLVPPEEVEQAAVEGQRWVAEVELLKAKGRKRPDADRELQRERAARKRRVTGDRLAWIKFTEAVRRESMLLRGMEEMAFWASAEPEEIADLLHEMTKLIDAQARVLEVVAMRADDDAKLATIAKLRSTNGRTAEEVRTMNRHIERIKASRNALGDFYDT